MQLAQIENNIVVNVAEFDPDNIPDWASDWIDVGGAGIGATLQEDGTWLKPRDPITHEELALIYRDKRDRLLQESDWTQVPDVPVDQEAWAVYRQALRDITDQTGFPADINWPIKPE